MGPAVTRTWSAAKSRRKPASKKDRVKPARKPLTYADAGVDIDAGDRVVDLIERAVKRTHGPRVLGPLPRYLEDVFALVVDRGQLTAVDLNELRGVPLATASDYLGELHRLRVALRERENGADRAIVAHRYGALQYKRLAAASDIEGAPGGASQ